MEETSIAAISIFIVILVVVMFFGGSKLKTDASLEENIPNTSTKSIPVVNHTLISQKVHTASNPEGIDIPPESQMNLAFQTPSPIKISKQYFDGSLDNESHIIRDNISKIHLTNSGLFTNLNSDENISIRNPFNKTVGLVETSGMRRWEHGKILPGNSIAIPVIGHGAKMSFTDNITDYPLKTFVYGR